MIGQHQLKQLLDAIKGKDIHSVELTWKPVGGENVPHPVITITKKQDSFIPVQLCPKCNGDGKIEYTYLGMASGVSTSVYEGMKECDLCKGAKVIPMIKSE